ncbi:hypothetical protein POJ06DRAFT_146635 [Lipomyces tetrasporus]|uniref:RmlD-like substrate binding domain-containing protein n=1 Tax=Lipomyces tetrasporus TaxID=54092 RepID=A0AAD7QMY1_9ASCO|nr:uncharacterized protein POJ06DRAFT_146635 [Lipomyces tetrasporus]KAJ8098194.1 hypothetical protein POJ06DRAFT_146635 [Lipomyces tetrasporus]
MATETRHPTVMVTGATGLLGREIVKKFEDYGSNWNVIGTGFSRSSPQTHFLDLTDTAQVAQFIRTTGPAILIHSAAERRPDVAASNPDQVIKLNVLVTKFLAELTAEMDISFIYVSTDYVFDGTSPPYEPDDEPNPTNLYGITKRKGELEALKHNKKSLIFRVPVLYGEVEKMSESAINILVEITLNANQATEVEMDNWQIRYPTNTEDIGRVLKDLSDLILNAKTKIPSILHFSASQKYTKYEICQLFGELLGVPTTHLKKIDIVNNTGSKVNRPHDCCLSNKRLMELGIDVSTVDFVAWWRKRLLPPRR